MRNMLDLYSDNYIVRERESIDIFGKGKWDYAILKKN